jgi:hypothetical protein
MIKSPVDVIGDSALKAAEAVVCPVPPFAIGNVPVTPVVNGRPVALVKVPEDGVPKTPLYKTIAPADPVLTPKAVATPVPRPDTPVLIGNPVAFVNVADEGVPNAGVTNVGDVANTIPPEPVTFCPSAVTTPVPVNVVEGAAPAPPPIIIELAAKTADEDQADELLKYGMPPDVPVTANV